MAALRDELLDPISGESPGGVALRYDPIYDKIKEARREAEDAWGGEPKKADWNLVVKLSKEALAKRSKDLQIAAWLTEALVRRQGYAGLRDGLVLLDGMLDRYWDTLYPEIEDGDLELRAAPLQWVGFKLDLAVRMVPVNSAGHDLLRYESSRMIPTESDAAGDDNRREQRELAISEGKLLPEDFDRSFDSTPADFYRKLYADLQEAMDAVAALDGRSRERFGDDDAPSYSGLQNALEGARLTVRQMLLKKDPRALDVPVDAESPADEMQADAGVALPSGAAVPSTTSLGFASRAIAEPSSRDDAAALVERAARYLRKTEPLNPASYLMLRGFRWGELRAGGAGRNVNPRLLEAPATQVRTRLKGLLLDQNWLELIEAGETVMATPQGRGWIDLQRYILTACDSLAGEYDIVANAIRAELRGLLDELPSLVNMTLMDDTPTANTETREWLRANVLGSTTAESGEAPEETEAPQRRVGDGRALAAAEARAGRPERAIELLMRELALEKTKRGRFLTQTQLASIMIDAGHDAVAMPILEELIALVEGHRLEEWEAGDVVARPMALLYRVLGETGGDEGTRQQLYLRICRLDPLQAIGFAQQPASGE
jgi:type VI secretion system protein ImpA